nr:protein hol1 [Quercus suber]
MQHLIGSAAQQEDWQRCDRTVKHSVFEIPFWPECAPTEAAAEPSSWVLEFWKAAPWSTSQVSTATLEDLNPLAATRSHQGHVKHNKNGIILVPQPSDDPNDPLNWPLWRRDVVTTVLCLLSVIASTLSPLLAANTLTLTLYFSRSFTDIALLTGYHLLGVGIAGFFFVASARVWGKRHLYLLGTVIIIFSSIWGGASNHNYNSLMAARFFQGVGLAPFEALVNASIGDLYFVHERGLRMGLSNLCLFGGAFGTPIIIGKLTDSIGWQWSFYLLAIFTAVMLPLVIFFVPETAFVREDRFNTDLATSAPLSDQSAVERSRTAFNDKSELIQDHSQVMDTLTRNGESDSRTESYDMKHSGFSSTSPIIHEPSSTFRFFSRASLMPFNGRKTNDSFFKLVARPLPLFFHPGIFWACLIQGALIGWTVFIGIVLAAIMLGPPLWFDEVSTGYMYTGAFIGAILGFVLAGALSDPLVRFLTKRNRGVYEPEFRLVLVLPQLVLGCAGLYGFGITAGNTFRYGWLWPDFFFALEVMGMVVGAVASALYLVDAHRDLAVEAFTCLLIFKNLFSFGLTYSAYDWLNQSGVRPVFIGLGSVQVVICCLTIPMCKSGVFFPLCLERPITPHPILPLDLGKKKSSRTQNPPLCQYATDPSVSTDILGKRNRAFFHRHNILALCRLDPSPTTASRKSRLSRLHFLRKRKPQHQQVSSQAAAATAAAEGESRPALNPAVSGENSRGETIQKNQEKRESESSLMRKNPPFPVFLILV